MSSAYLIGKVQKKIKSIKEQVKLVTTILLYPNKYDTM